MIGYAKISLKPSDADESIKEIVNDSGTVNNKEVQPIERILNSLSSQEVIANELFHNTIEAKISRPSFETWMKGAVFIVQDDKKIDIIIPNSFASEWIATNYVNLIKEVAAQSLSFNNAVGTVDVMTAEKYVKANMSRVDV